MCYDINEFDPFKPIVLMEFDGSDYIDSEPMTEYDWESWLETMENDK